MARFFENKVGRGAEDLAQATFLRMIEGRDRMQTGGSFRSFMFGIARNVLREHLRQLAQDREVDPAVDSVAMLSPGPSTLMGMQQEHRLMLEGLRNLSINDQILLELFYWEQLKAYEIAEIMGSTPSSTRRHLAEARARLDEKMAQLAASPAVLDRTSRHFESWVADVRRELGGE